MQAPGRRRHGLVQRRARRARPACAFGRTGACRSLALPRASESPPTAGACTDPANGRPFERSKQQSRRRRRSVPHRNELGHLACANHTSALSPKQPPARRYRFRPRRAQSRSPDTGRAGRRRGPCFVKREAAFSSHLTLACRAFRSCDDRVFSVGQRCDGLCNDGVADAIKHEPADGDERGPRSAWREDLPSSPLGTSATRGMSSLPTSCGEVVHLVQPTASAASVADVGLSHRGRGQRCDRCNTASP
jgi:hypothetical protein